MKKSQILVSLLITLISLFIFNGSAKACSCYYLATTNEVNGNSIETSRFLIEIAYTSSSADVVDYCSGTAQANGGSVSKSVCTKESLIDRGNPFDVDSGAIEKKDCSVNACQSANIKLKDNQYVVTDTSLGNKTLTAIDQDEYNNYINSDDMENTAAKEIAKSSKHDVRSIVESPWDILTGNYSSSGCGIIGDNVMKWIRLMLKIFQIAGPILVVVLGLVDFFKSIISNEDDATKKAIQSFGKRLILVVVLILVPILVNFILTVVDEQAWSSNPTCGLTESG